MRKLETTNFLIVVKVTETLTEIITLIDTFK